MAAHPGQRRPVTRGGGRELPGPQNPAGLIGHAGHMHLGMGIHAAGDGPACICDRGHVVSISCTDWDGTAGPGTDGQSTSGTTEVGLLSGHGRPQPGGLHILPAGPGRRFVIKTRSRGQLSDGPGRGPAAGRAKPRRTKSPITGETPQRSNPQPHLPHSEEVLSDGVVQGERAQCRRYGRLSKPDEPPAMPRRAGWSVRLLYLDDTAGPLAHK